jgi:hypothetical protein
MELLGIAHEHFVEFTQRGGAGVQERLAMLDGSEPIRRQQGGDFFLKRFLLMVETQLASLDRNQ